MRNKYKVAEHLAKVFLNLGQGIALAGIIARLIQHQVTLMETVAVIGIGIYTVVVGLYLISEYTSAREE